MIFLPSLSVLISLTKYFRFFLRQRQFFERQKQNDKVVDNRIELKQNEISGYFRCKRNKNGTDENQTKIRWNRLSHALPIP